MWYRANGDTYEYIGTHTDDLMVASKEVERVFNELKKFYSFKATDAPKYHLGVDYVYLWVNGKMQYEMGSFTYIAEVLGRVKEVLGVENLRTSNFPIRNKYQPEQDESPILDQEHHLKYQQLIGIGVWLVAIGRFDIAYAISSLSRFSACPRVNHLMELKRVFEYLNKFPDRRIRIDSSDPPDIGERVGPPEADFSQQYPDAKEEVDPKFPKPKGRSLSTSVWFDSDHAHDKVTFRSITGLITYVGSTPVYWASKRQGAIETSTYGAEFVAGRVAAVEAISIRYLLRSLGVPIKGETTIYGDNLGMLQSSSIPEAVLKKKHCAISFHKVRECVAARILKCYKVQSNVNRADLMTKAMSGISIKRLGSLIWSQRPFPRPG